MNEYDQQSDPRDAHDVFFLDVLYDYYLYVIVHKRLYFARQDLVKQVIFENADSNTMALHICAANWISTEAVEFFSDAMMSLQAVLSTTALVWQLGDFPLQTTINEPSWLQSLLIPLAACDLQSLSLIPAAWDQIVLEVCTAHHFTFTASSKLNPAMARAYSILQDDLPEESSVLPCGFSL